jgi:putative ABC transport system substrate-binding protein
LPRPSARLAKRNIALAAGPQRVALGPGSRSRSSVVPDLAQPGARSAGTRGLGRRAFITLLGGAAAAWPLAARAQQPAMPVIGFLNSQSPDAFTEVSRGFRLGLKEAGFAEGDNMAIEYRWAENQTERLPALAADLVRRRVAVIAAMDTPSALAAKAATTTIAIVFATGSDPVRDGLVSSFARPGGNLTGVNFFAADLAAKRLGLLRELVPGAARIAVLVNPAHASITEATLRDVEAAAGAMGLQVQVLNASTGREIAAAFATLARDRPDALLVGSGPFINARRVQLALLAGRHGIPAIYTGRQYVEAGGLISYGASLPDAWRQVGVYAGRMLKGAKPVDLPVLQASKFEMVINAETARMLGLDIPPSLLATADEVIE